MYFIYTIDFICFLILVLFVAMNDHVCVVAISVAYKNVWVFQVRKGGLRPCWIYPVYAPGKLRFGSTILQTEREKCVLS